MKRRDWIGIALAALVGVALELFRAMWFEPRAIGLACLHGTGNPAICNARATLGWLTHYQAFGGAALLGGIWSIAGAPFAIIVASVCCGIAGLIDYNVSWSMLGTALAGWSWLATATPTPPAPAHTRSTPATAG